jgi:hypothetical protein
MTAVPETEFCPEFTRLMKAAMDVSYYKYGAVADAYPHKYGALDSMQERLRWYANGNPKKGIPAGNREYLVDAANFLMIEFMHPAHPEAHFKGTDEEGSPGRRNLDTGRLDQRHNLEESTGLWVPGAR